MDCVKKQQRKVHPIERTNLVSIASFFYTLSLFRKGFKRDLEEEDLYEVISHFRSKQLGNQLELEWEKQKTKRKNNSIVRLLWACYGWKYLTIGMVQLIVNTTLIVLQPRALGRLVAYFVPGQTELTKSDAYFYAGLVVGINLINCVYDHNYQLIITGLGMKVRTAFCSLIYRKALRLSPERLGDISIGKIVTLITKDVRSFEAFVHFANDLWIGLVKTAVMCYVIYARIGVSALAGVGFFFVVMPLQIYLGKWSSKLRMKMCKKTDDRLQITQESLSAIKVIKMYTWEKFFNQKIAKARKSEISSMHKTFYVKFFVVIIGILNSKIAFYLLIMTYVWLGNNITAEIVYFILSCFQILTHSLSILFPLGVTQSAELFASAKRIGNVLKALEIEPTESEATIKPRIILKNVSVNFKDQEILHDINLDIDIGVTLIAGPVGSGKSFLLKTILQDFVLASGNLDTRGRISYAPQEPWLFPSSIKQNIVFGEKLDEKRYQNVLKVCALKYDLEMLSAGDSTIVEDRGTNLSKGQQARVNLARAVYKDCDIYLLDDCLSALDAHVSDYVFKECIIKFLKNKLVVLVTHNTNHLNEVDNIVTVDQGRIKSSSKSPEVTKKDIIQDLGHNKRKERRVEDKNNEDVINEETKLVTETTTERKVYHEVKKSGQVEATVFNKYIRFGGGWFAMLMVLMVFGIAQFVTSYTDKLVSKWVNVEQEIANYSIHNMSTEEPAYDRTVARRDEMLNLYTVMIAASAVLFFARSMALFVFARKASINLHKYMVNNIINATMNFFDNNFIGNILNRFSKDLTTIDEAIPFIIFHLFRVVLILVGIVALIATVNVTFLIPAGIFLVILAVVRRAYIPTGRCLERLEASTRSPVIGYLNATLEGLTTIRAFKAESILKDEFDRHQDLFTSATYIMQSSMRAFCFFLDILCTFFIAIIVTRFLVIDNDTLAGNVGLAISQAFLMTGTLQWGIRQWAEINNEMVSVERVLEYTEVKQEGKQGLEIEGWPPRGEVRYQDVSLIYPNTTEKVLKNINFVVHPKEKIGIVGRTGAGKSSIISTLFRLYEVEGKITIDGVDTKTLSLNFLRSEISIIPQDPVLFTGNVRNNIDPTGLYTDEEIWHAIETANLKNLIPTLDLEISENGSNFSVGQRQLICLARAVTRNNKIIVLDEATANMDHETDILIHETIQKNFASCTVITIAHKLHSILNSDKVMVLDQGEIIEYDDPRKLLGNEEGVFYKMVQKAGLLPS